jgi:hypothetical protein
MDTLFNAFSFSLFWTLTGPLGNVVNQRNFGSSDSFEFNGSALNLAAGAYQLNVGGVGANTGNYAFRLLNLSSAALLPPGTPQSGTLDPALETDVYRFNVTAGQRFFFDAQTGIGNATWRLLDTFGNQVFNQGFTTDSDVLTLSQTGDYTLSIEGRQNAGTGAVAYTFNVAPVTDDTAALAIGATVNATINEPGERDFYTFTLASPARLVMDTLFNAFSATFFWTLTGPSGTVVNQRGFGASDSFDNSNPALNLVAGNYTLTVDPTGDAAGAYAFRLLNLSSAALVSPGTPQSGSLNPATETDLYRFSVTAGQRFYFDVQTGINNATWRLIDTFGNQVFNLGFSGDVDVLTLSQTGDYTLSIEGRQNATGTQAYAFNVVPVTDDAAALTIGATVNATITEAGERDFYTFTLASPARLVMDMARSESFATLGLTGFSE